MALVVRRGFVEWDLAAPPSRQLEKALWEVGVRAALLRKEAATELLAPFVRGVDIRWAEASGREKFNTLLHREVQIVRVNWRNPITRAQARSASRYGKYVELPIRPLLKDLPLLWQWLEVLEPEATVVSTPVESLSDIKAPLDVAALLVEVSRDSRWETPVKNSLAILTELVAKNGEV
ncbi:MAG: hypothetical protein ACK4M3_06535 [Pyrobaculum sp.]